MTNASRDLTPLLPARHAQLDFFVCDIFDATPKSDMASMEHPLFTLATRPDFKEKEYRDATGRNWVKITPHAKLGCATVHDRDVLIYCISQLMAALNEGRPVQRTLRFHPHAMLTATNRETNGQGYDLLQNALERLSGTRIQTNITTGGKEAWEVFGFIERARIVKETREGRMEEMEITLSEWIFNAIREKGGELLTISRDYFRLRKPMERRLYEIARKHCGQNAEWKFKVETLHAKMGSQSALFEFRRMLTKIIDENALHGHIPDYSFSLENDVVTIQPKSAFKKIYDKAEASTTIDAQIDAIQLRTITYERARELAGGWDIYGHLEGEWRRMLKEKQSMPNKPDGSFLAFVKWYRTKHGTA